MKRSMLVGALLIVATLWTGIGSAAAPAPELSCQAGKNAAAGAYAQCQQTAQKNLALNGDTSKYNAAVAKCEAAFSKTWQALEAKAAKKGVDCPDDAFIPGPDFITSLIDRNSANIALGLTGMAIGSCEASKLDLRSGTQVTCTKGVLDTDNPCTEVRLTPSVPNPNQRAKAATASCSCVGGPLGGMSGTCSFITIPGGVSCHGICTQSCVITIDNGS